jgi:uncharacterized membrane protein YgdD (TMEM256/DUF423 family)
MGRLLVAALNTIREEHVHTVLIFKPTAIVFALGIFLFAGSYLFTMYARITIALSPSDIYL